MPTFRFENNVFYTQDDKPTNINLSQPNVRKPKSPTVGDIVWYPTICRYVFIADRLVYPVENYAEN